MNRKAKLSHPSVDPPLIFSSPDLENKEKEKMKSITSSLLTLLLSTPTVVVGGGSVMADMEERFVDWMKLHDKGYQNTMEMLHRMDIWLENHGAYEAGGEEEANSDEKIKMCAV